MTHNSGKSDNRDSTKLKAHIKFCKFEGGFACQVITLDSRWQDPLSSHKTGNRYEAKNGFILKSTHLSSPGVYVGWSSYEVNLSSTDIYVYRSKNYGEAELVMKNLIDALIDWSKNWDGWGKGFIKKDRALVVKEYEGGVVEVCV